MQSRFERRIPDVIPSHKFQFFTQIGIWKSRSRPRALDRDLAMTMHSRCQLFVTDLKSGPITQTSDYNVVRRVTDIKFF